MARKKKSLHVPYSNWILLGLALLAIAIVIWALGGLNPNLLRTSAPTGGSCGTTNLSKDLAGSGTLTGTATSNWKEGPSWAIQRAYEQIKPEAYGRCKELSVSESEADKACTDVYGSTCGFGKLVSCDRDWTDALEETGCTEIVTSDIFSLFFTAEVICPLDKVPCACSVQCTPSSMASITPKPVAPPGGTVAPTSTPTPSPSFAPSPTATPIPTTLAPVTTPTATP